MNYWDWESPMALLKNAMAYISDPGELIGPIEDFEIIRAKNLSLELRTHSSVARLPEPNRRSPGEIYINEAVVEIKSSFGEGAGIVNGVTPYAFNVSTDYSTNQTRSTQNSKIDSVTYTTGRQGECQFIFEWIANFDNSHYFWPTLINDEIVNHCSRVFDKDPSLEFTTEVKESKGGRGAIRLTISGHDIVLGPTSKHIKTEANDSGFILYVGAPDERIRKKIRDSLSFTLGAPLIHLGHSKLDQDKRLLEFYAKTPVTFGGKAWEVVALPPVPITDGGNIIDPKLVTKIANHFFEKYDQHALDSFLWRYWHAVTAPAHMAPAYFGAIIESIQSHYTKEKENKFSSSIIAKTDYRALRRAIVNATKEFKFDDVTSELLMQKLGHMNSAPQRVVSQRFFDRLGLNMGELELGAWSRRNDAAHGNEIPNNDYIALIKDTKLLKLILHRVIAALLGTSGCYIDYYTINFPVRMIGDHV